MSVEDSNYRVHEAEIASLRSDVNNYICFLFWIIYTYYSLFGIIKKKYGGNRHGSKL